MHARVDDLNLVMSGSRLTVFTDTSTEAVEFTLRAFDKLALWKVLRAGDYGLTCRFLDRLEAQGR